MYAPYIISGVIVAGAALLCFVRPGAGRLLVACIYLLAALVINLSVLLTGPWMYAVYIGGSTLELYREINAVTLALHPTPLVLLLVIFQMGTGLLILSKGWMVRLGLLAASIFLIALTPVDPLQYIWLGLVAGQVYLMSRDFSESPFDGLFWWLRRLSGPAVGD